MAPKSDPGFLDMGQLLDLLNSSEAPSENTETTQPTSPHQELPSNSGETPSEPAPPDVINSPTHPKETAENRFAAHIVQGMSKLRQG